MTKDQLLLLKLIAAGTALFYVYHVTKANGGTLKGNKMGVKIQGDKIVDLANNFVPREWRPYTRQVGNHLMGRILS